MPRNRAQFRIRSLHPNLLTSERYSELSDFGDVLFVRLQLCCDDEGRTLADPRLLRSWLFPLRARVTAEQIDIGLAELDSAGLICRYADKVIPRPVLQVVGWAEFQRPRHPRPSALPAPDVVAGQTAFSSIAEVAARSAGGSRPVDGGLFHGEGGGGNGSTTSPEPHPPTPAQRGSTTLRSRGDNPRAQGTNPRAEPAAPNPIDECDRCTDAGWLLAEYPNQFIRCAHGTTRVETHRMARDFSEPTPQDNQTERAGTA